MALIDPASLLVEVAPDAPCGNNLEYDSDFLALDRAARTTPQERAVGPNPQLEEPNWAQIVAQASQLFARTKDLRIASLLTRALLRAHGLPGLRTGMAVMRGLVEQHWDQVHPQLEAENDNDPTMRINALRELNDRRGMLIALRATPLVRVVGIGTFSLRDLDQAEQPGAAGEQALELAKIEAAFANCDLAQLKAAADDVAAVSADLRALAGRVTDKVGAQRALNFEELSALLEQMERVLVTRLASRNLEVPGPIRPRDLGAPVSSQPAAATGEIASRADVQRILEQVCAYYERNEPSSPVPLLLRRAQRLSSMSFMDIVRDLAPSGAAEVETIRGPQAADNT
jgi:type VI secretion system protein ImpA